MSNNSESLNHTILVKPSLHKNSWVNAGHFGKNPNIYNGFNCGPTLAIAFLGWPKPPCRRVYVKAGNHQWNSAKCKFGHVFVMFGLASDCSDSIANALELLQCCTTKPGWLSALNHRYIVSLSIIQAANCLEQFLMILVYWEVYIYENYDR